MQIFSHLSNAFQNTNSSKARQHIRLAAMAIVTENFPVEAKIKTQLTDEEIRVGRLYYMEGGGKIPCIKLVRARTYGLKEAKDLVEAEFSQLGYSFG